MPPYFDFQVTLQTLKRLIDHFHAESF